MNLDSVAITNFRSIASARIDFSKESAKIVVGINESGKSNVLKALSLLSETAEIREQDKRVEGATEDRITESEIEFHFRLSREETDSIFKQLAKNFRDEDLTIPIVIIDGAALTLQDLCTATDVGVYSVDLMKKSRQSCFVLPDPKTKMATKWSKLSNLPGAIEFSSDSHIIQVSATTKYIPLTLPAEMDSYVAPMSVADVYELVGAEVCKIIDKKLPKCLLWTYDEKLILPGQVSLSGFISNPQICVPLKNCFELAGIKDIPVELQAALTTSRHSLVNILTRVGKITTEYVRSVWKDHASVTIEFHPDGDSILPIVKEKSISFDFNQRSDGFKRFISFLLLIASKVRTKTIENTLILVDEPDIGLHPSGARNLMHELLRMAEKNIVVYSTHSIFMIDRESIGRHLIAKKSDEVTEITTASKSRIYDEEVIYQAVGFSMLEVLKPINIVFEGWRDKILFDTARPEYTKRKEQDIKIQHVNQVLGICHAEGVKDIRNIAPLIALSGRKLSIISDADAPAREQQKRHRDAKMFGCWMTYQDITGDKSHITGEDFLADEAIIRRLEPVRKKWPALPELTAKDLSAPKGKLKALEAWVSGIPEKESRDRQIEALKSILFDDLKHHEIEPSYQAVIDHVFDTDISN